jgi:hypothetical protein
MGRRKGLTRKGIMSFSDANTHATIPLAPDNMRQLPAVSTLYSLFVC